MGRLNYTTEEVNTILDNASRPAPPTPAKVSSGGDMVAKMYFHRKRMPINAEEGVTYFTHQIRILKGLTAEDFPLEMEIPSELLEISSRNFHLCYNVNGRFSTYLFDINLEELGKGVIKITATEPLRKDVAYSLVCVTDRGYYERRGAHIYNIGATHKEEKPKMKYPKDLVKSLLTQFLHGDRVPRNFEISILRENKHKQKHTDNRNKWPSYKTNRWTRPTVEGQRPRRVISVQQDGNAIGPHIIRARRTKNSEWQYFYIRRFSTQSPWSIYRLHKRDTLRNRIYIKMTATS